MCNLLLIAMLLFLYIFVFMLYIVKRCNHLIAKRVFVMKANIPVLLLTSFFYISCSEHASDGYEPFPEGYGYMEKRERLQRATDEGDRALIRDHAWKMWAGIMQPDKATGWPLWYSWQNTTAAFSRSKSYVPTGNIQRLSWTASHW
jgi:hypothetical protein